MKKATLLALIAPPLVGALSLIPIDNQPDKFHSEAEIATFRKQITMLASGHGGVSPSQLQGIIDSNILFPTSLSCNGCHGHDPNMVAFITSTGEDVNIYDDWRSTMMANSARDPFWRAKVSHEMLVNPAHSLELQDKCTSCHAPAGHYQAKLKEQQPHYGLADLYSDSLGLDGVTCQACHAQSPKLIGSLHSGNINFDTNYIRVAYGPYKFVFAPPMHNFVGITPEFGEHIGNAGLCASCHTLITNTADLNGNNTGSTFIEQATYHEWLNSRYDESHDNISCQNCHMPQIPDPVVISANYAFLFAKYPFGLHELAGANVTMLRLMKDNRQALGIPAEAAHFDSTIAATLRMLQQKSVDLTLKTEDANGDTMHFSLKLQNKAGHKFPSGYPARRAWVEFEVSTTDGQMIFHSGKMNPDYTIAGENSQFEPHHSVISSEEQVQIYEMVPVDVESNFTNVLERCFLTIKDNRLPPQGFKSNDPVYDTTRIIGLGNDKDFNLFANLTEGSGADVLHFKLPNQQFSGYLNVRARVWYQSLPPKWMAPIFAYSSPEIDAFKAMFDATDQSPILVAEALMDSVKVSTVSTQNSDIQSLVSVTPTLNSDGKVWISAQGQIRIQQVSIWNASGQQMAPVQWQSPYQPVPLPATPGYYFVVVDTDRGRVIRKVFRS
ncbi:MAG: hypothetical protein J0M29_18080 [Chitinophagales bacterium]|nr:hypothetical protein [Chitinophagales bacterium]